MRKSLVIGSLCTIVGACLVPAAPAQAGNGDGCIPFFDKGEFEAFSQSQGKFLKGIEDFEESNIPDGGKQFLEAPLVGNVPNVDPITGFGFPNGLLQKNLIILDNITQGPNPPRTNPSGSPIALFVIGTGFIGSNSKKVGEDLFLKGIHASLDLIFTEPNHTGVGFELSRFDGFPIAGWHVTVYNKNDDVIGKFQVEPPLTGEPGKSFFGIWCFETIGRINIFDKAGPAPDAIDNIQMWVDEPANVPTCPWDCGLPRNKIVDITDLLALLAQYDAFSPLNCTGGTCDFDGSGCVDVVDLLKLLAQWNLACPPPINDTCDSAIKIDRNTPDGRIIEHFDMYGATPSPERYVCHTGAPDHKDIWYCLNNVSSEEKHVTVRIDIPLFIEVTDGCTCPPGPLVACDFDSVKFLMQPGQSVAIRLIDVFDLPNDLLKGTLFITNNPVPLDALTCPPGSNYSQVPHQPTDLWIFGTSDKRPGFKRYEDFAHDGRFIDRLVFWGADLRFDPKVGFVECDLQNPFFNISFYQDDGSGFPLKDDPICTYFVRATQKEFAGEYVGALTVNAWRYTVDLNPQCRLPAGKFWVSIQGAGGGGPNDPNDCWFLWLSSPEFNLPGSVFENENTGEQLIEKFDLSLCTIGKDPVPTTRCGQCGPGLHWIDTCPGGNDVIAPADHGAVVGIDLDLDCIPDLNITLAGLSDLLIRKEGKLDDSLQFPLLRPIDGHLDVIDTEILQMQLSGGGVILRVGKNQGGVIFPSLGAIAEDLGDPTIGNSFFDVFFEVELPDGQFIYNQVPLRVIADITCVPPRANYRHPKGCIPLFTSPVPGQGIHVANLINANHFLFENLFGCPADDPANGPCCAPNKTPFCENQECCRRVCAIDPFCCDVLWDDLCASAALKFPQCGCEVLTGACCFLDGSCEVLTESDCVGAGGLYQGDGTDCATVKCGVCGDPAAGDCCIANGTPFCDDFECCELICTMDAFCCDTDWDSICADQANALCPICGAPLPNDDCENAIPIAVPSTTQGTTSGANPDPAPFCGTSVTTPGVWYSVIGTGNTITATTCTDFFDYDTKLSVYCSDCAVLKCVDGNDDNCFDGASSLLSTVSWCSEPGCEYLILVHGFGGQTGDFDLIVTDDGIPCKPTQICCAPSCGNDIQEPGEECDGTDDAACPGQCQPDCTCPPCGPGNGDCCIPNGTPGCDDPVCCEAICAADSFCCDVDWDQICADAAAADPNCNCP